MNKWNNLNTSGKLLYIMCIVNVVIGIYMAMGSSWLSLVSIIVAMYCGISTFHDKYLSFTGRYDKIDNE